MNDQNLSAFQPWVNDSLVIFPLKTACGPWITKVAFGKIRSVETPLQLLGQKHLALGCHPSQAVNPRQYLGPYLLAYGDLRHLKRHHPTMANHLRSDLDQLGQEAAKGPVFDASGKDQTSQKIAQVVG